MLGALFAGSALAGMTLPTLLTIYAVPRVVSAPRRRLLVMAVSVLVPVLLSLPGGPHAPGDPWLVTLYGAAYGLLAALPPSMDQI